MTPANKRMRIAVIAITATFLALTGAVFAVTSDEISTTRGDFCAFAAQIVTAAHQLPQAPGRVHAEQAYARLETKLGCGSNHG